MWKSLLSIAIGVAPGTLPAQSVFKCTDKAGAISIQQTPCPGAGELLQVRPNRAPSPAPAAAPAQAPQYSAQSAAEADKRAVAIAAGMSAGYPVIGMNADQLAHVLGGPSRVYTEDMGDGPRERRIYRRGIRTTVIMLERGKVTSIQQDAEANQRPISRARECNSIEMRNIETAAAGIAPTDPRRAEVDRRIANLRSACR